MKIGINGFGRIGRSILRAYFESKGNPFEIVAVNDLSDIDTALHLLKYDSVHGNFNAAIEKISETSFRINNKSINYSSKKNPEEIDWADYGVDLVLECTGIFKTKEKSMAHIKAGAKKVLISCPAQDVDKTIVYGVNDDTLTPQDIIVSNASCTTNCLAPVVKVIYDWFGIKNGFATTIHSYTGDQRLVDTYHKDLRRTRASALSMIPTSTGATKAIELIFPKLKGKLSGLSVRVPTPNVSMIDFTFTCNREVSVEEINHQFSFFAHTQLEGILGYTNEELVSIDFNHSPYSAVIDLNLTKVIDKKLGHVVAWYDNEWGFANRMLDVAGRMLKL